ncbi:nucleoside kinase [Clostridium tarantellae]|uniref:Nucleoside kinase n=1 Tax=Clostridium tarantellae TaxID=39493 RepID=A0A6I1MRD2_9CLOT|nr:nucleoside kinase [Clostridium tarantellae]
MKKLKITLNKKILNINKGEKIYKLLENNYIHDEIPITLAKLNNTYYELTDEIKEDGILEWVRTNNTLAMIAYARTLQFVFIKATLDIFNEARINIEHSINKGIFGEVYKLKALNKEDILLIKNRMQEIIKKNIVIEKLEFKKEDAIEIFKKYKMEDKVKLLQNVKVEKVKLYKIEDRYDYFYGDMAYSTGILKYFDVIFYEPGFILSLPSHKNPTIIIPFVQQKQLANVFRETERWLNILDVACVGALNEKLEGKDLTDIIRVSEALHEKKIAQIADMIKDKENIKVVLIAGPSSSGKTTFSKRLSIQLRVNGYMPISVSLDDYFINRENTPLDEEGKPDFESIYTLDLNLFNNHLNKLLLGEEVEIPVYNFKTGSREWHGNKLKLPYNGILVIEGIHALNPKLTEILKEENKFKVYISALTQLNLDNHNRIPTTDVRKVRRIVRDALSRGYNCEKTLEMWPSIKRGEEKNIFIYQEQADIMFNSTLVYEFAILKKYCLNELEKVNKDSIVYYEAKRLIKLLKFFKDLDICRVPENSILREFIGGSCFYNY